MGTLHTIGTSGTPYNPRQEYLGTGRQFRSSRSNPPTQKGAEPALQLAKVASLVNEPKNVLDNRQIEKPIPQQFWCHRHRSHWGKPKEMDVMQSRLQRFRA